MRKIATAAVVLMIMVASSLTTIAQKPFKGKVVYEIKYEGRELTPNEKMQMPTQMTMLFGDDKVKQETETPMGNVVVIEDLANKKTTMLLDLMGNKVALVQPDTVKMKENKNLKIEEKDETKTIAGYKAKKMVISKGDTTIELYYAVDLYLADGNKLYGFDKRLKNIPLEYTLPTQDEDLTLKYKAKEVTPMKKVKKKEFKIPPDYQQVTMEEFKKMFGGGGQ